MSIHVSLCRTASHSDMHYVHVPPFDIYPALTAKVIVTNNSKLSKAISELPEGIGRYGHVHPVCLALCPGNPRRQPEPRCCGDDFGTPRRERPVSAAFSAYGDFYIRFEILERSRQTSDRCFSNSSSE